MIDLAYKSVQYDIYDPSNSVAAQYWQMGIVISSEDVDDWQQVGLCVNQGFPFEKEELFHCTKPEHNHEMWGCLRWKGAYWVYRYFLTGRDRFDRPGRYFFVLFKIDSMEDVSYVNILHIINLSRKETSIPLDLGPLLNVRKSSIFKSESTEEMSASSDLKSIFKWAIEIPNNVHAGKFIKHGHIISEYSGFPVPKATDIEIIKIDESVKCSKDNKPNEKVSTDCPKKSLSSDMLLKAHVPWIFSRRHIFAIVAIVVSLIVSSIIFGGKYFSVKNTDKNTNDTKKEELMKYSTFQSYLENTPKHISKVTLSLSQIETVIGDKLPSSSNQRQWWENPENYQDRPQAKAWLDAGFKVDEVELKDRWVSFIRK